MRKRVQADRKEGWMRPGKPDQPFDRQHYDKKYNYVETRNNVHQQWLDYD